MRNPYRIEGDLVYMLLKNRKGEQLETVFNIEHLEKISAMNLSWHLKWEKNTQSYYCKATKYIRIEDGGPRSETIHLHNVIRPLTAKGNVVHHKNHKTLDNTDSNLEEITSKKNVKYRRGANPNNKTGVRNVSLVGKKYVVTVTVDRKAIKIGSFDNLEEAAQQAKEARRKYYGIME